MKGLLGPAFLIFMGMAWGAALGWPAVLGSGIVVLTLALIRFYTKS